MHTLPKQQQQRVILFVFCLKVEILNQEYPVLTMVHPHLLYQVGKAENP